MKEGEVVTSARGTVTSIRLRERRIGRTLPTAKIVVTSESDDDVEEYQFDVPAKVAEHLRIGQTVGIEIKVIAAGSP